jgi:hypothetical protein
MSTTAQLSADEYRHPSPACALALSCHQNDGLSGYDVNIFITPH